MHPTLQMSTAEVYGWTKMSSGARYHLVTTCLVSCRVSPRFCSNSLCCVWAIVIPKTNNLDQPKYVLAVIPNIPFQTAARSLRLLVSVEKNERFWLDSKLSIQKRTNRYVGWLIHTGDCSAVSIWQHAELLLMVEFSTILAKPKSQICFKTHAFRMERMRNYPSIDDFDQRSLSAVPLANNPRSTEYWQVSEEIRAIWRHALT